MTTAPAPAAWLNAVAPAPPAHEIPDAFIGWARGRLPGREAKLFDRMVERAGIGHRWAVLPIGADGGSPVAPGGFYADAMPGTAVRMTLYADAAPTLAISAIDALAERVALDGITHLVVCLL